MITAVTTMITGTTMIMNITGTITAMPMITNLAGMAMTTRMTMVTRTITTTMITATATARPEPGGSACHPGTVIPGPPKAEPGIQSAVPGAPGFRVRARARPGMTAQSDHAIPSSRDIPASSHRGASTPAAP